MPEREVSAEEVATWYSPIQAVIIAARVLGDNQAASNAIWQRIIAGQIECVSSSTSTTERGRNPDSVQGLKLIPPSYWQHFANIGSDLWRAGDARFLIPGRTNRHSTTATRTIHCFGIKLNPANVHDSLPPIPPEPEPAPAEPEKTPPPLDEAAEPAQRGPRVSDAHLQAWWEFYKKTHSNSEDTEDRALEFARLCFPGKSVARDRVRALRGTVKRGPKPRLS
jgi:hypothetical protein